MATTLGTYIKDRRVVLGYRTQGELAERAGINRAHLSQIESGKIALPNADLRRKLATALGVSHLELLVVAGEIEPEEVQQAGAEGVLKEDAESPKGHVRAIVEGLEWTEEAALQAGDILKIIAKRTR